VKHQLLKDAVAGTTLEDHCLFDALMRYKNYPVYKAQYFYGQPIIQKGVLQTPDGAQIPKELLYHTEQGTPCIPLALVLTNCVEVFETVSINDTKRTVPLQILRANNFFGVFETGDYIIGHSFPANWNVSAGVISVGVMANIGNSAIPDSFKKRLCSSEAKREQAKFYGDIKDNPYKLVSLIDRVLCTEDTNRKRWSTDIIFFPREWFVDRKRLNAIKPHLFEISHIQAAGARHALGQQSLRAQIPALTNYPSRLQHIIDILAGTGYFFEPVTKKNEQLGPFLDAVEPLQASLEGKVKNSYRPVFLQPVNLSSCKSCGYISLKGWPYIGDSIQTGSGPDLAIMVGQDFAESIKSLGLRSLLNAASLIFFDNANPHDAPVMIFHSGQTDAELGSFSPSVLDGRDLLNERIDGLLPAVVESKHRPKWYDKSIWMMPVVKVIPNTINAR
jgi:hypothetical protein